MESDKLNQRNNPNHQQQKRSPETRSGGRDWLWIEKQTKANFGEPKDY
ncbi:uncharacterized protein G2W53_023192 [Senna tora]|uniref:Uncharacterized protein n=1 Tax=Senna tora TaxID=362788 RepID=A0A834T9S5_9FABA|nr:uncharacterized protein G2W53_023192 [Senna tora]